MSPTHDGATPHDHPGHRMGPAPVAQWVGLFLAPAVFFAHLQVGYLLVLRACRDSAWMTWVHVAGALAVVLSAVGLWAAWLAWQRAGAEHPGEGAGPVPRTRMVAASGLGLSGLLVLLLATQWVAAFVVPTCR